MILIKNGKIFTGTGQNIEKGDLLIDQRIIKAVGENISVDETTEIIDAAGNWIMPGFVDAHCHLGLFEQGIGFEGKDVNEATDPVTPHVRGLDGMNPLDPSFRDAVEGGVTTVAAGPGSINVIGGQFCVIKTHGDSIDEMIVKEPQSMKCAFGENVKKAYAERKQMPMTRMGNAALLRETLVKSKEYEQKLKAAGDDPLKKPPVDFKLEAMLPVVRCEIPLKIHAHRADDILTAIRIAKEFDVRMTLEHCTEGHLIARHIANAGIAVIAGPSFGFQGKFELKNKSFETPKILHEAGVLVAIMTDHPVMPIQRLNISAAMAMKAGLPFNEAIKAISINAAKIIDVDHRVGSLDIGKDADVVIWNGNPLEIASEPLVTIINGEVVYRKELI